MYRILLSTVAALTLMVSPALCGQQTAEKEAPAKKAAEKPRTPDVVYVPTPQDVVEKMLQMAKVTKKDLVYDLGCGDGRIVVTAAKKYGCRAVGFEIHPERLKMSLANVKKNKVEKLVQIKNQDIFKLDLRNANVITLYLLGSLNVKLIPQLEKLEPGSRIVSHDFDMEGVEPDKHIRVKSKKDGRKHSIYLWTTPLKKTSDKKEAPAKKEAKKPREPDVVYVPTPQDVVEKMLQLAKVTKKDLVYDLGCGDGRIVVTAAKKYGCRAVGFEIHPERLKMSLANVKKNKVEKLVQIKNQDIFKLDLSKANVVTLYLLPDLNVKLIPQLDKLKRGSRIVSHDFDMRGVKPDKEVKFTDKDKDKHTIYLWTTPLKKVAKKKKDRPKAAAAAAL